MTRALADPKRRWEKRYRADLLRNAGANHIWLNALSCIRPTDQFLIHVGRQVLAMLDQPDNLHISESGHLLGLTSETELVVRINKS